MNKKYIIAAAALVAVLAAGGYALYEMGMRHGSTHGCTRGGRTSTASCRLDAWLRGQCRRTLPKARKPRAGT
jgi:hypothetical protein